MVGVFVIDVNDTMANDKIETHAVVDCKINGTVITGVVSTFDDDSVTVKIPQKSRDVMTCGEYDNGETYFDYKEMYVTHDRVNIIGKPDTSNIHPLDFRLSRHVEELKKEAAEEAETEAEKEAVTDGGKTLDEVADEEPTTHRIQFLSGGNEIVGVKSLYELEAQGDTLYCDYHDGMWNEDKYIWDIQATQVAPGIEDVKPMHAEYQDGFDPSFGIIYQKGSDFIVDHTEEIRNIEVRDTGRLKVKYRNHFGNSISVYAVRITSIKGMPIDKRQGYLETPDQEYGEDGFDGDQFDHDEYVDSHRNIHHNACMSCNIWLDYFEYDDDVGEVCCPKCLQSKSLRAVVYFMDNTSTVRGGHIPTNRMKLPLHEVKDRLD